MGRSGPLTPYIEEIVQKFDTHSVADLAREYGVDRQRIYALKARQRKKGQSQKGPRPARRSAPAFSMGEYVTVTDCPHHGTHNGWTGRIVGHAKGWYRVKLTNKVLCRTQQVVQVGNEAPGYQPATTSQKEAAVDEAQTSVAATTITRLSTPADPGLEVEVHDKTVRVLYNGRMIFTSTQPTTTKALFRMLGEALRHCG